MKRHLLLVLTGLAVAIGVWAEDNPPTLALGSSAPDFDLPGVDGRNWRLSDFAQAKVLVVVFTTVHCPTGLLTTDNHSPIFLA